MALTSAADPPGRGVAPAGRGVDASAGRPGTACWRCCWTATTPSSKTAHSSTIPTVFDRFPMRRTRWAGCGSVVCSWRSSPTSRAWRAGLISPDQLVAVNAKVDAELGPFDAWQVCVHDDDDRCACRKPRPGMVLAAADALGVPPERCVMIGDTGGDVDAALAANARAVLVPTDRTRADEIAHARDRAKVAASLTDAVSMVLRESR